MEIRIRVKVILWGSVLFSDVINKFSSASFSLALTRLQIRLYTVDCRRNFYRMQIFVRMTWGYGKMKIEYRYLESFCGNGDVKLKSLSGFLEFLIRYR